MKKRIKSTREIVDVELERHAIYRPIDKKDGRRFIEGELESIYQNHEYREDNPREIPYWVMDKIDTAIRENILPHHQIAMLPDGCGCTPMYLGTYMSVGCGSGEWKITITDWYGDRSQNVVVEHKTAKGVISLDDIIYWSLRDILHLINVRYPGDKYLVKTIRKITEFAPELLELQYFKNNKFLTEENEENN